MKWKEPLKSLLLVVCGMGAVSLQARRTLDTGLLSDWTLPDTEVTTNFPVSLVCDWASELTFGLEFFSTSSNNVQVAFGSDANTNGVVELRDEWLTVGWDCGRWIVRGGLNAVSGWQGPVGGYSWELATTSVVKRLEGRLKVVQGQYCLQSLAVDGEALPVPESGIRGASHGEGATVGKVTVRGVDEAGGRLGVCVRVPGGVVIIR